MYIALIVVGVIALIVVGVIVFLLLIPFSKGLTTKHPDVEEQLAKYEEAASKRGVKIGRAIRKMLRR